MKKPISVSLSSFQLKKNLSKLSLQTQSLIPDKNFQFISSNKKKAFSPRRFHNLINEIIIDKLTSKWRRYNIGTV